MARASGISRGSSLRMMTRIIGSRTNAVTFERPTTTTNALDETVETTSEYTENVWLFQPEESVSDEITGERINGSLGGLVIEADTVDIQSNDRITYGGVEYEVDTVVGYPQRDDATFLVVDFVRRNT